jgi:uncharacterized protein involved in cysteine biosynthesis
MSSVRTLRPGPPGQQARARYRQVRTQATATASEVLSELRDLTGHPPPAALVRGGGRRAGRLRQVVQGLLQPLHAARLLIGDRELLMEALLPALLLLGFCLGVGFLYALASDEAGLLWPLLKTGLSSFAVLAPVPSIVMANHYGRLCAQAHERMQLGPCKPRQRPLISSAMIAGRQLVAVAVAIVPLSFALHLVPWLGARVAQVLLLLWALHWIVVEALDDGCVDAELPREPAAATEPSEPPPADWLPWFLWPVQKLADWLPGLLGAPLRFVVRRLRWLCSPWHKEITLIEQNLPVMLGFATTTAALLCKPVLNLVFRPITVVAAVRLLGHLRLAAQAPLPVAPLPAAPPAGESEPH